MSEARALTNFSGNAVATVVIGGRTKTIDRALMSDVLDGKKPFDEQDMRVDDRRSLHPAGLELPRETRNRAPGWRRRDAGAPVHGRPLRESGAGRRRGVRDFVR